MIEVAGISKRFGDIAALSDVSFTVKKGEIVGFLGANGAGKTTTMDILCGCIGADTGFAKIAGFEISEDPKKAKHKLGYLPDEPPLHNDMKVEQFIAYAARLRGVESSQVGPRVDHVIQRLSLGEVRDRLVGNLSKGFRQRVGLAQALVHDPDVLVLDEPTEGLDPNQIVQIRDLIRSLKGEHTIIFSSHILSEVQSICDQIIIIDKGRVVEQGTYAELVRKLEAGQHYTMRVAQNAARLVEDLTAIPGIAVPHLLDAERGVLEFQTTDRDDVIDTVARHVLEKGYGLREVGLKSKTLEDVFFQLTKKR